MNTPKVIHVALLTFSLSLTVGAVETKKSAAVPSTATADSDKTGSENMELTITGQSKDRLTIERVSPPAAFTIQDIQSFPKDLLEPVLFSSITLQETSDFARLMDFRNDQPSHPWQPEMPIPPFIRYASPGDKESFRSWEFSVVDQDGKTVYQKMGAGRTPAVFQWNGVDSERQLLGVDVLYTPQVVTVNKDNKRRTHLGTPTVFPVLLYQTDDSMVIEFGSKRMFPENKATFFPEAVGVLERATDWIRASGQQKILVQVYDDDLGLGAKRAKPIQEYLMEALVLPLENITIEPVKVTAIRGEVVQIKVLGAKPMEER